MLLSSCAKVGYLWDQGWGQMNLLRKGRPNSEVLADKSISEEARKKIKLIETYKSYFYDYWKMKPTGIYSETTFLEGEAVTYLVIASPYNLIKAKDHCFPFMGCFPYLGFFSEKKAEDYAAGLRESKDSWQTYVRPVYAYSTLGYFEDRILSSFFHYSDEELADLIFHELFHTLFFIKDEVDLNEALASYFARQMALEYFSVTDKEKEVRSAKKHRQDLINRYFVSLVNKLNEKYKEKSFKEPNQAITFRDAYFKNDLIPKMEEICREQGVKNCYWAKKPWNNASLAAFLTYEDRGDEIEKHHKKLGVSLKDFFSSLKNSYAKYEKEEPAVSFTEFWLGKVAKKKGK